MCDAWKLLVKILADVLLLLLLSAFLISQSPSLAALPGYGIINGVITHITVELSVL